MNNILYQTEYLTDVLLLKGYCFGGKEEEIINTFMNDYSPHFEKKAILNAVISFVKRNDNITMRMK